MPKIYRSIFRNVRMEPRGFNYIPRYYDERKSELDARVREIEREVAEEDQEVEIAKARISHKLRGRMDKRSNVYSDRSRMGRLVLIIALLFALFRAIYRYLDYLEL